MGRDTYATGNCFRPCEPEQDSYEHWVLCPDCKKHRRYVPPDKPILKVVDGNIWPDFITSSYSSRPWFLSERVANLRAKKYGDLSFRPIHRVEVAVRGLKPPPFQYFDVAIERTVKRRLRRKRDASYWCACCFLPLASPMEHKDSAPEVMYDEWQEAGLAVIEGSGRPVCARNDFVELARNERWTGLLIHAVHREGDPGMGGVSLDIFDDIWPPKRWFA